MSGAVLSLFSGAGGMDLGLESAGFETIGAIEVGDRQRETLSRNRPWQLLGDGDINEIARTLRPKDLGLEVGDLDVMAGGPPCQPFSTAAQWAKSGRRGMLDDRAQTVVSTVELIERFLPRAILIENVIGFVQGANSAADYLKDELERIGRRQGVQYSLSSRVLNAADFGVPQNRRRAIVVAMRDDVRFAWPVGRYASAPRTAWDALHDVAAGSVPKMRGKWASLVPSIPPGWNYQWLTSRGGGPEMFGYRTKYWNFLLKLKPDLPAWTLSASPGPATGPFHWDNRPLAAPEQLRLQSFVDGWRVSGDHRSQTLQIGNATPPALAEVLGISLRRSLGLTGYHEQTLVREPATSPAPLLPAPKQIPSAFAHLVGSHASHAGVGLGPSPRLSA